MTIQSPSKLPYQVLDLEKPDEHLILREVCKKLSFPLSAEDRRDIEIIERQFDHEENMAGLAAPQIGISKQIIIFAANDDDLKKWRPDFSQSMAKTIWINPQYIPLGAMTHEDYEACFSVNGIAGQVKRYQRIQYSAFDIDGNHVEGIAEGFLARIIQHEIDHVQGKLFVDYLEPEELLTIEEYREKRRRAFSNDK